MEPNVIFYGPADIGAGTYVGPNSVIGFPSRLELAEISHMGSRAPRLEGDKYTRVGRNCVVRSNCVIYSDTNVGESVRFGHNVMLREDVSVGAESLIGTGVVVDGSCRLGRNVSVQTGVYISTNSVVEDCVFLGPRCVLINDRYVMQRDVKLVGPTICRGASVGANATVFPGVTVGPGAVVGAGAVVMDDVAPRTIVAGVPARKLKDIPQDWHIQLK